MAAKMPLSAPTRTIDSVGQIKHDRVRVPNFTEYVPASEWNNAMDELIAVCQLALNLAAGGATGTLQQVYNNGLGPVSKIIVDLVRNGIILQDANPTIGVALPLLAVTKTDGTTYLLKIANDDLIVNSNNGGIKSDNAIGGLRLIKTNGCNLHPSEADKGTLGDASNYWNTSYALAHASKCVTVTFAASPVFDAAAGSVQRVVLTGNMTSFTIVNLRPGQIITLIFQQDGFGSRNMTGTTPAAVYLRDGESSFSLCPEAGYSTVLTFRRDTLTDACYEIGRCYQSVPYEKRVRSRTLTNGTVTLTQRWEEHTQFFSGTLNGVQNINIINSNSYEGDVFYLNFDETTGVTTSAANTLQLQNNGVTVKTYDQAKTLRGSIRVVKKGTDWLYCIGGALSYA